MESVPVAIDPTTVFNVTSFFSSGASCAAHGCTALSPQECEEEGDARGKWYGNVTNKVRPPECYMKVKEEGASEHSPEIRGSTANYVYSDPAVAAGSCSCTRQCVCRCSAPQPDPASCPIDILGLGLPWQLVIFLMILIGCPTWVFACCLYHTCLKCSCCFDEYGRCLFWLSDEEKDELRARAKEREEIRARAMQKKKEEETRARAKKKEETRARSGKSRATAKVKPDNKYETTEVETFAETPPEAETENSSPSKDSPPGRDRILRAALVSELVYHTLHTAMGGKPLPRKPIVEANDKKLNDFWKEQQRKEKPPKRSKPDDPSVRKVGKWLWPLLTTESQWTTKHNCEKSEEVPYCKESGDGCKMYRQLKLPCLASSACFLLSFMVAFYFTVPPRACAWFAFSMLVLGALLYSWRSLKNLVRGRSFARSAEKRVLAELHLHTDEGAKAIVDLLCKKCPGLEWHHHFESSTNAVADIFVNPEHKEIYLAWRGTQTTDDAINDVKAWSKAYKPRSLLLPDRTFTEQIEGCIGDVSDFCTCEWLQVWLGSAAGCHSGFLKYFVQDDLYKTVRDEMGKLTKTLNSEQLAKGERYTVIVCGHSLGGALANLAAIDLCLDDIKLKSEDDTFSEMCEAAKLAHNAPPESIYGKVRLITFGAPRMGNAEFVQGMRSLSDAGKLSHYRIQNEWDKVPRVYVQRLIYHQCHSGQQIWLGGLRENKRKVIGPSPEGAAPIGAWHPHETSKVFLYTICEFGDWLTDCFIEDGPPLKKRLLDTIGRAATDHSICAYIKNLEDYDWSECKCEE